MATYIIQAGPTGPVKIGRADDPEDRMRTLQTGQAEELRIIRIVDTPYDCEGAFHERFAEHRLRGEWFRFHADMMTFIPAAPEPETISGVMRKARKAARTECQDLMYEIWHAYRDLMDRDEFYRHMAVHLEGTQRRVRALINREARRIEVHELAGLRALAQKLRADDALKARVPLPLFAERRH